MIATESLITLYFLCGLIVVFQMKIKLYFLRVHSNVKLINTRITRVRPIFFLRLASIYRTCRNNSYWFHVAPRNEQSRDMKFNTNDQRRLLTIIFIELKIVFRTHSTIISHRGEIIFNVLRIHSHRPWSVYFRDHAENFRNARRDTRFAARARCIYIVPSWHEIGRA